MFAIQEYSEITAGRPNVLEIVYHVSVFVSVHECKFRIGYKLNGELVAELDFIRRLEIGISLKPVAVLLPFAMIRFFIRNLFQRSRTATDEIDPRTKIMIVNDPVRAEYS